MKNDKRTLAIFALLILIIVAFVIQQQRIDKLAKNVNELNDKADQSNLAAKTALQQSTELVQAVQTNQKQHLEAQAEWENREPIGFKLKKGQG